MVETTVYALAGALCLLGAGEVITVLRLHWKGRRVG